MTGALEFFRDNAMFYKDMTQWLRNRTFVSLYFGLLCTAEAISLLVILNSDRVPQPGVFMFNALFVVLMLYGVIIAALNKRNTRREYESGSYEIIQFCGLDENQVLNGKLLSMLYQFAFGFFCLVPFMFFAYFLDGLDFLLMLTATALSWAVALPYFLFTLLSAVVGRHMHGSYIGAIISYAVKFSMLTVFFVPLVYFWPKIVRLAANGVGGVAIGDFAAICFLSMGGLMYVVLVMILYAMCAEELSLTAESEIEE